MDELFTIIVASITVLFLIVTEYCLDVKRAYPVWVMNWFSEPWVRFALYATIYLLACLNIHLSILFAIAVVLLHVDYINLAK